MAARGIRENVKERGRESGLTSFGPGEVYNRRLERKRGGLAEATPGRPHGKKGKSETGVGGR